MRALPLGAVLVLRTRAEEDARAALGRALAAERDARRRCEALAGLAEANFRRLAVGRLWPGPGPSRAATLQAASRFGERLRDEAREIERAASASADLLRERGNEVDRRRDLLAAARSGVRAIERHRERWGEARRREIERRVESEAEDGVTARAAAP